MSNNQKIITVGVGDLKIAKSPHLLKTLLGSCIGIVLHDHVNKVGGILHIMLPFPKGDDSKITKYADPGLPYFIQQMLTRAGSHRSSIFAKIFGGAKMFQTKGDLFNIGDENEAAVRRILQKERIQIVAAKTGGVKGYNIVYDTESGEVSCRVFGDPVMVY
ncbi:MAG: chemotaxis protein CheD [Candidatus Brocadiaceae bacterium]|nr:chemotaxis protein CheD [Candidatus Brocadiaceae bacterium]